MVPSRKPTPRAQAASSRSVPATEYQTEHYDIADKTVYQFQGADQYFPISDSGIAFSQPPALFEDLDVVSTDYSPQVGRPGSFDGSPGPFGMTQYGPIKFPMSKSPGYQCMFGSSIAAPPSVDFSVTSRGSSASSTLSSIHTERQQHLKEPNFMKPFGPSQVSHPFGEWACTPLSPTEASEGTLRDGDLTPRRRASIGAGASKSLPHICLWGINGPCKSGGFATKEELTWHVKAQHLLLCPVIGCTEGSFENTTLVDVHLRWAHKSSVLKNDQDARRANDLLSSVPKKRVLTPNESEAATNSRVPSLPRDRIEEMRLKMDMTIATSKKRCRDQLRNIIDRRAKRQAVVTPRSIESPGMMRSWTPRAVEVVGFPIVWEHGVLPFLVELMPKWCGPGHVISVIRSKKRDARRVCIMTEKPLSKARKITIAGHVRDLLPETHRSNVGFAFSIGEVERLTWARGLSKSMPDDVCIPRNPFCYISPQMGDSIGMILPDGDTTATLGPCLKIGDAVFWLANFHPFVEADLNGTPVNVEHPSPEDRDRCISENHDTFDNLELDIHLGQLTATSGYDLKTTRITHDPYWEDCDKEPPLVVMDWSLISSQSRQANMLRKFPNTATPQRDVPITRMSEIVPGIEVCSTGRTSGYQYGQVCEIPAYLDGRKNGTGKATREWFIEEPYDSDDEESWIRGGMGVPGDSGAAVVDCETNALIGQLWGRNKYFGSGPRLAFFTPIFDIFDDIQEKCGEQTRPQLPQYRDEADRWPAYPICRPCFDLQEYLAGRRSSRESLLSMIPGAGIVGDNEHDVKSISELATPNESNDQAYWIRHAGTEDTGSSFASVVSPVPVLSTFFHNPHVASPRPHSLEMMTKTPYAADLRDDDLREADIDSSYSKIDERLVGSGAMMRSGSQQSAKRRRIM